MTLDSDAPITSQNHTKSDDPRFNEGNNEAFKCITQGTQAAT